MQNLSEYYTSLGLTPEQWHVGPEHPYLEQYAIDILSRLPLARVLEIGYQCGGFAIPVICRYAGAPGFSYYGIDNGEYQNAVPQHLIEGYLRSQGIDGGYVFARGEAAVEMAKLAGMRFDLVLIDHYKPLYARELFSLLSQDLLAETAYILLHDVLAKAEEAWKDCQAICEAFGLRWEIVAGVPGGLAVVRKERVAYFGCRGWRRMALRLRLLAQPVMRRARAAIRRFWL